MQFSDYSSGSKDNLDTISLLNIESLQTQLTTHVLGIDDRLLYKPEVDSTNTLAMQLAGSRSDEGLVVLTDNQTAGKGRLGRRWVDVAGLHVLSSIVLRPAFPPHLLVMLASLAVSDAISDVCGLDASIKWPNDVLVHEHKVTGILVETSRDTSGRFFAVLGIGINVNGGSSNLHQQVDSTYRPALSPTPSTLETEVGHSVSREHLIARLLEHLEAGYLALQQDAVPGSVSSASSAAQLLRERWQGRLSTLGRAISVRQGEKVIEGVAEDVDVDGQLLLRLDSGELLTVTWGDIGYPSS